FPCPSTFPFPAAFRGQSHPRRVPGPSPVPAPLAFPNDRARARAFPAPPPLPRPGRGQGHGRGSADRSVKRPRRDRPHPQFCPPFPHPGGGAGVGRPPGRKGGAEGAPPPTPAVSRVEGLGAPPPTPAVQPFPSLAHQFKRSASPPAGAWLLLG